MSPPLVLITAIAVALLLSLFWRGRVYTWPYAVGSGLVALYFLATVWQDSWLLRLLLGLSNAFICLLSVRGIRAKAGAFPKV